MIFSVGIDLHKGQHRVYCLDDKGQPCDSFNIDTSPEGLTSLEKRVFSNGSCPIIVFEPSGLTWLMVAAYLRSSHPECRIVRAKGQKVAALRRYLRGPVKCDRIDALTLAKMPFIDPERLDEVYLPPAKTYALQRLTQQRKRIEDQITTRKKRINSIVDGYLPGVRQAFSHPWSAQLRAFLHYRLNPYTVAREGEEALQVFFNAVKTDPRAKRVENRLVYQACMQILALQKLCAATGMLNEDSFVALQDEIDRELRLMETEEAEAEAMDQRIEELYREIHPSNNLRTIPGVGEHTAPVFAASIGDPKRFPGQAEFLNWTGVVPAARQSSNTESKGLRMTKAGPATVKWSLYQAAQIGRRWDPQLAFVYYRQMVYHGKNHKQAMGAVMSHLGARIFAVLKEDRPYELKDIDGSPINASSARKLILANYHVPEEVRQARRKSKNAKPCNVRFTKQKRTEADSKREAVSTPQPVYGIPSSIY
ncbi:MAG: IS110 family transposase [Dehalococcoidaceae bacterium]|nr:IS110 family transposase [Dehalococcoidaceae bacterium]